MLRGCGESSPSVGWAMTVVAWWISVHRCCLASFCFHVRWVNDQPCDSKDVIVLRNPVRIDMYRGEMARLCECPLWVISRHKEAN